jgi:plastocyanin
MWQQLLDERGAIVGAESTVSTEEDDVKRLIPLAIAMAVLALVAGAAVACGGGDEDGGDDGNGGNGGAPTAAASPANGDDGDDGDDGDNGDDGDGSLTVVAKNTLWDKTELRAEAGEVTIEVDNQDAGIVHNIHVYKGSDSSGEDVGMTDLEAGPSKQTLTFTADAGEYFYVCDAHPATMAGTLTVS